MIRGWLWCLVAMGLANVGFAAEESAKKEPEKNGLIYEAEDWTEPKPAWKKDSDSPDHWNFVTNDPEAQKLSKGSAIKSPNIEKDREKPEEGGPVLHTTITEIPKGSYRVFLNDPIRTIAYSYNGTDWIPGVSGAELLLGIFDINDGKFELWIDDKFSTFKNTGSCYYDYIRMEPYTPPTLSSFEVTAMPNERTQVSWISSEPIDTGQLELQAPEGWVTIGRSPERKVRNHRVSMGWREPGMQMRVRVKTMLGRRYLKEFEPVTLTVPPAVPNKFPTAQKMPLRYAAPPIAERAVTLGLPLKTGQLWQAADAWVEDKNGPLLSQSTINARWPDGSAKWLMMNFVPKDLESPAQLVMGSSKPIPSNPFIVIKNDNETVVQNGRLSLQTPSKEFALFGKVEDGNKHALVGEPLLGNIRLVDDKGKEWGLAHPEVLNVDEQGPVQAVLRAEGAFQDPKGERLFRYRVRYFMTADSPLVRVQLTVINDASDPYFGIKSLACRIPLSGEGPIDGQLSGGEKLKVEEKSENWIQQVNDKKLRNHHDGKSDEKESRTAGWAVAQRGDNRIAVAVRDFWQTWPKGIAMKTDGLHIRLLPELAKDEYQAKNAVDWLQHDYWFKDGSYLIRRGCEYRAEFWVRFDHASDPVPSKDWAKWAEGLQTLPYTGGPPVAYCDSGVFGPIKPAHPDQFPEYDAMVERTFAQTTKNRDANGEYGWLNFGDWFGDHSYNWGNNQYDWSYAMALQFARTGRWEYFQSGEEMARHYAIIDTFYIPFAAMVEGRAFGPSVGHWGVGQEVPEKLRTKEWDDWKKQNVISNNGFIDAGTHVHTEGGFLYYFLTGDRDELQAAELMAISQAAYMTTHFDFDIERGAVCPLINTVAAYEATGNPFYLNAARIFYGSIRDNQNPQDGGWRGGDAFSTGNVLYALMRYHLIDPKEEAKQSIIRACDWLAKSAWDKENKIFRGKMTNQATALCVAGLAYGATLASDGRFDEVLHNVFPKMCEANGDATLMLRQSAYALPAMAPASQPSKNAR